MSPFIAHPLACTNPEQEESLGIVLQWMAESLKSDVIRPMMRVYGVENFDPNKWYPTQTLLYVVRDLYKEPETTEALVSIGKKSAEGYRFDSNISSFEDAVWGFNKAYHAVHRGIHPEEGILVHKPQPGTLIITNNTPWPGQIIYGALFALGHRFHSHVAVTLGVPDEYLRATFEVTWKNK